MAQRQFRSDDTSQWSDYFGNGLDTDVSYTLSATTTQTPFASVATGTAGSFTLTATNASFVQQYCLIMQPVGGAGPTAGSWEINKIASYVAGTVTLKYPLTNSYLGGQILTFGSPKNITVPATATVKPNDWNGATGGILVLFATNSITVAGAITANGVNTTSGNTSVAGAVGGGFRGGLGLGGSSNTTATQGEGTNGAGAASTAANGNGGGGASVASGASDPGGGGGGHVGSGTAGAPSVNSGVGGSGGGIAGNANLTLMVMGGGGGGKNHQDAASTNGGASGAGIVVLMAPTITVTGSMAVTGGSGNAGNQSGGAGAGGSILMKGLNVTLGSTLVTALAGSPPQNGGNASNGRIHVDYGISLSGTTNPTVDSRLDTSLIPAGSLFMGQP